MSAQSSGLVASAQQNEAGGSTIRNRSRFPLSYSFFNTERFAEYTPFYVAEAVATDKLPLNSNDSTRTYSLKSPLMQNLVKKKDFFYVPCMALLPLNWEKFFTNPVIGEDVPDDVGLGVEHFWNYVSHTFDNSFSSLQTILGEQYGSDLEAEIAYLNATFRFLVFYEYFYSTGSLMESLGISGHTHIHITTKDTDPQSRTWDDIFDQVCSGIIANVDKFEVTDQDGIHYLVYTGSYDDVYTMPDFESARRISFRMFLEMFRDDPTLVVSGVTMKTGYDADNLWTPLNDIFIDNHYFNVYHPNDDPSEFEDCPLNLGRLWAYQMVCHHFYSNDHVDFVYSADLFRQYINQLIRIYDQVATFSVNGLNYQYDSLSAHYCAVMFDDGAYNPISDSNGYQLAYFASLLSFRKSLRYLDYFSGSRTRPLAVGDSKVDVNASKVDVLDLARGRMMAKFLQAVNRSGRKFGAYMKELFGEVPAPDYHNPFYLAHVSDVVGTSETENTAEGQLTMPNSITSVMRGNSSRYVFEFTADRDCIVIGLTYYDIPRVYGNATERQNFYLNRFDMFNPYMQFIGDQPIYQAELGIVPSLTPFGYTNRHQEYKIRYNQCAGGFLQKSTQLMNWLFLADEGHRLFAQHQSSSFIRSFNSELDKFYISLTGFSNGTYFHFISRYDNRQDASRPMAAAPVIA